MPKLTVSQLNKKLEEARRAGYSEQQIQQVVSRGKQKGLIDEDTLPERIVKGAIKPFTDFGRSAVALGAAGTGLVQGLAGDKEGAMRSVRKGFDVLTPEQQEAYTGSTVDAALQGLRTGAGIAPYALPGGKTLAQAAGLGFAGGASRGFYDTQGEDLKDTLGGVFKGGAGGAIFGGATYGAGKAFNALRGKGGKLQQSVEVKGTALADDPFYGSNVDQLQRVADDIGLDRTMTPKQQVDTLERAFGVSDTKAKKILKEMDIIDENSLMDIFEAKLKDIGFDETASSIKSDFYYGLVKKIANAKGNPQKLDALKSEMQKAFINKSDATMANSLNLQAKEGLRDAIVEVLGEQSDDLAATRIFQKDIYNIAKEITKKAKIDNPIRLEVPFVSPGGFRGTGAGLDTVKKGTAATIFPKIKAGIAGLTGAEAPRSQAFTGNLQLDGQPVMSQVGSQAFTGNLQPEQIDTGSIDMEFENQQAGVPQTGQQAGQQGLPGGVPGQQQAQQGLPQIMQQPTQQPDQQDLFKGKSKQQVLREAWEMGADQKGLQQISAFYDQMAPKQEGANIKLVQQAISNGVSKGQLMDALIAQGVTEMTKLTEFSNAYDFLAEDAEEKTTQQVAESAVNQLETLFGRGNAANVGTDEDLALGGKGGLVRKAGGKISGVSKQIFDPGYEQDLSIFRNQVAQVLGLFTQATGSGAPQEAEAKRLLESMPGPGTGDKEAKAWFDQLRILFEEASGVSGLKAT